MEQNSNQIKVSAKYQIYLLLLRFVPDFGEEVGVAKVDVLANKPLGGWGVVPKREGAAKLDEPIPT